MIKRKRKINKQSIISNLDMRVKRWLVHPVYIRLRRTYGTLKAVDMLDDAALSETFVIDAGSCGSIVTWSDTNYFQEWLSIGTL